jgi:hypothetical protein
MGRLTTRSPKQAALFYIPAGLPVTEVEQFLGIILMGAPSLTEEIII